MSFESFYGGRRGASFIIAKSFTSKEEMIAEFQKGSAYKEVKFDEYVLISSEDRTYRENGNVYKRGYDYTNDLGGAVFIGRFSGPSGISIQSVEIDTGDIEGTGSQKINIAYDDGTNVEIGNGLNYIMRTAVDERYHLLVLHADPEKRNEIVAAGLNATYEGRNDWQDLGPIKSYNGIMIGLNLNALDIPELDTPEGAINYLNITYPNGLEGIDLKGKVVIVTDLKEKVTAYAFDYTTVNGEYKGWFHLGGFGTGGGGAGLVIGPENDETIAALVEELPENGAWFIVEE